MPGKQIIVYLLKAIFVLQAILTPLQSMAAINFAFDTEDEIEITIPSLSTEVMDPIKAISVASQVTEIKTQFMGIGQKLSEGFHILTINPNLSKKEWKINFLIMPKENGKFVFGKAADISISLYKATGLLEQYIILANQKCGDVFFFEEIWATIANMFIKQDFSKKRSIFSPLPLPAGLSDNEEQTQEKDVATLFNNALIKYSHYRDFIFIIANLSSFNTNFQTKLKDFISKCPEKKNDLMKIKTSDDKEVALAVETILAFLEKDTN